MVRCAGSEKRRDVLGALRGSSEMRAQKWDDGERSGARADGMRMGHDCEAEGSDRLERAPVCKRCSVNSTVGCGTVCYVHRHVGGPRSSGGGRSVLGRAGSHSMRTLLWDLGLGLVGPRRCSRRGKIGVVYELEQREVTTRNAGARKGSRTAHIRTLVHRNPRSGGG